MNKKIESRQGIVDALTTIDFGRSERLARINSRSSGLAQDDLHQILNSQVLPDGIVVPKVEQADDINWVADSIDAIGEKASSMRVIGIIESSLAMINLSSICRSSHKRLDALIFGADDYAADTGAIRTKSNREVSFARNHFLMHACAFHLQAIDLVSIDLHDLNHLQNESIEGYELGFAGKQVIHPKQVDVVQQAFSPSPHAITKALKVLDEHKMHQLQGRGAFTFEGKMIDMPTVKQYEKLVAVAKAAGIV